MFKSRTIKSLNLDLESAKEGKLWLLLPEGFRDIDSGKTYPLPTQRQELQKVGGIYIPPRVINSGAQYIKRAAKEAKRKQQRATSVLLDVGNRKEQVERKQNNYNALIKELRVEARQAVDNVRVEAERACASLKDLFALGREGIEGQMKAYLAGEEYKGETINKKDFQNNFRMVTQAVKGLGLPTGQEKPAGDAIVQELADCLKNTHEALDLSSAENPETDENLN